MSSYGRRVLSGTGRPVQVSADGLPEMKTGGVTIDWSVIAAAVAASTLALDETQIKIGEKHMRAGQVVCEISGGEIVNLVISGTPTGGTFTVTVGGQTTGAQAYNVSAASLQSALEGLSTVGAGKVTVAKTGSAVSTNEVQTVAISGTTSAGGYRIRLIDKDGKEQVTTLIAYNGNLAAVQAALDAVTAPNAIVAGGTVHTAMTLTFSGADYANRPQTLVEIMPDDYTGYTGSSVTRTTAGGTVYTGANATFVCTFATSLGDIAVTADGAGLTGGSSPAITVTTTSHGARNGYYGPYDPAATDGRQFLLAGKTFILNETVVDSENGSDNPPVLYGGRVWKDRVIMHASSASLANGPTQAALLAALPRLVLVE